MTFTDYCAANPTLCGSLTQTAGGAKGASSTGLILLGATGVGALTAGAMALSNNPRSLSP